MGSQQHLTESDDTQPLEAVTAFPVVMRGYDRATVDAFLRDHQEDKQQALAERDAAERRADDMAEEPRQLRDRLAKADEPSYSHLGEHATELLKAAESQAADITAKARSVAERTSIACTSLVACSAAAGFARYAAVRSDVTDMRLLD